MKHDLARTLRRNQTDLERKLWYILRGRRFHAHKFRRQQPIGPYIADFVCFERKLVIELDGSQHAAPAHVVADRARTAFLESQGFRVLRFWNLDFIQNRDGVLWAIDLALGDDSA
jgi:very-short-patch-repair endonuclease